MNGSRRELLKFAATAPLLGCTRAGVLSTTKIASTRSPMRTRPLLTLKLTTAAVQDVGAAPRGERVTYPVTGGSFEGDRLRGKVLGGDDWTIRRADSLTELDLRITLKTDDGALIYLTFEGLRDDDAEGGAYFRTLPRFEASSPKYAFLNRLLAVGTAEIRADGPTHVIEELL